MCNVNDSLCFFPCSKQFVLLLSSVLSLAIAEDQSVKVEATAPRTAGFHKQQPYNYLYGGYGGGYGGYGGGYGGYGGYGTYGGYGNRYPYGGGFGSNGYGNNGFGYPGGYGGGYGIGYGNGFGNGFGFNNGIGYGTYSGVNG